MSDNNSLFTVATFYAFLDLGDLNVAKVNFLSFMKENNIKGTILLAKEGINATVVGSSDAIKTLHTMLTDITVKHNVKMFYKESLSEFMPFEKVKVKIKPEIVTFKHDLDIEKYRGEYLNSSKWDDLLNDPNAVIVDTRNNFEVEIGTFKNAINPKILRFTDFSKWIDDNLDQLKDKKVGMFCTGGIRCEKATAYLKSLGHDEVYHLEGGILQYFIDTQNKNSNWQGGCFVFDDRKVVDEHQAHVGLPEDFVHPYKN